MQVEDNKLAWDFSHVIGLLHTLAPYTEDQENGASATHAVLCPRPKPPTPPPDPDSLFSSGTGGLGNFSRLFDFFANSKLEATENGEDAATADLSSSLEKEKAVKWRDETDGADLEDNIELEATSVAWLRTRARAARRAKAKRRKAESAAQATVGGKIECPPVETDTGSGESDLETLPTPSQSAAARRAVIHSLLYPTKPIQAVEPPKATPRKVINNANRNWPVSEPFSFTPISYKTYKQDVRPLDDLSAEARRYGLLQMLQSRFPHERKYLMNQAVGNPNFSALNVASEGVHVFIDISNISIGFHDRLKATRNISLDEKVRRVPIDFLNFSLILERGRPASKRVLVGSDQFPHIDQARSLGYETNILERVHKAKALKKDYRTTPRRNGNGYTTSGGASSGSETNTAMGPAKWVEQAVDEILHLKILESIVDADKPGTIVLATGDAAVAEYSGGFLRMVERALSKGWTVEIVAFTAGLSGMYRSFKFRNQWGPLFKIIELDEYAEYLLDVDTVRARC